MAELKYRMNIFRIALIILTFVIIIFSIVIFFFRFDVYGKEQIIDSLDLSAFNVIDCDSYGIPFEICEKIIRNKAVKSGTVVIYTAMMNIVTHLPKICMDDLGINEMYGLAPSLFNLNAITYFYDMLANLEIKEINYYEVVDCYTKHYGYFVIP
jgi:hypothetical protein